MIRVPKSQDRAMILETLQKARREKILKVCARYGARNVRVLGFVA